MLSLLCCLLIVPDRPDVLIADFEGPDYGTWKTTGSAFGSGPARGTLPGQMHVSGYLGKGLVNSFRGGDANTGSLTSPPFTIERNHLNFLIGGGKHAGKTCMNLLLDGKVVRTATGPNDQPGGSEELDWQSWQVEELLGKTVVLQIVDEHTDGWGHINVDHIVQSDKARDASVVNVKRQIVASNQYLLLPIKHKAKKRVLNVQHQGKVVRQMDIELAEGAPDWWAALDVSVWQGQSLTLVVDKLPADSTALASVKCSATIEGNPPLYQEKHRPQLHFSSRRGWLNDPNGLVYYPGEYHLFYQHNPYGWDWGNMHWGHAVSSDMIHWKELPIALYPHRYGDWAFSGSAVVDHHNTSGLGTAAEPPMVAAYTSTGRGECIVYSVDRGRTWKEYERNPVIKHDGRDPRLVWHAASKQWVMVVYDETNKKRSMQFYTSPNLKEWTKQSQATDFFECPDFYELPVMGKPGESRWVLSAASQDYFLGKFDGKQFTPEGKQQKGHYGKGYYAAQTFSHVLDDRRIIMFWLQAPSPGMPFNQAMSIPLEVTLQDCGDGLKLCYQPVREFEKLRVKTHDMSKGAVEAEVADIEVAVKPQQGSVVELSVRGLSIKYDVDRTELQCQGMKASVPLVEGRLKLWVILDRTSLEIIAGRGAVLMPLPHIFVGKPKTIELKATGEVVSARVHELRSIWK